MSVSTLKNAFGRNRLMALLCCLLFVFAVACGDDDDDGNNGTTNNGTTNNGTADAGDVIDDQDTDDGDVDDQDDTGDEDADDDDADDDDDAGDPDCQPLDLEGAECDPKCQTGCADGQTCVPSRASAEAPLTAACAQTGTAGQGEACGQTGCQEGLGCYGSSTEDAICQEICVPSEGDASCTTEGTTCTRLSEGDDVGVCVAVQQDCEIFPPEDTCGEGENCYQSQGGGTVCAPFNPNAQAGDSCSGANDCNDLQACAGPDQDSLTCLDKCDPNAETNRCAEDEQCAPFQNDENVGACVPAQG